MCLNIVSLLYFQGYLLIVIVIVLHAVIKHHQVGNKQLQSVNLFPGQLTVVGVFKHH